MGCGALKLHGAEPAELKRMWIDPGSRGLGVGRRLLEGLETLAREKGRRYCISRPTTPSRKRSTCTAGPGFEEVAPFNDEPYAHLWFEKTLR